MRGPLRYLLTSLLVGVLSVGLAWAGSGLVPVSDDATQLLGGDHDDDDDDDDDDDKDNDGPKHDEDPAPGLVLAGASKISIEPRPQDYGGTWVTDRDECATLSESLVANLPENLGHAAAAGSPWPENPNCIYMGGFGIGPMNPVTSWDQEFGLWVRSFAVKGPNGKTLTMTILDGEGYFWDYKNKCDDCGIKQITAELAADPSLGLEASGMIIAATHAHSAPDFIGGWGFVPDWYMAQVTDSIKQSIRSAVADMRPAVLEMGEELARPFNNERRDTYRSAEEQELTWLRAVATEGNSGRPNSGHPDVIATIGAYAGHPTTYGTNDGIAHADWPARFLRTVEDRFGGVGLYFMTGLGNMSAAGREAGAGLASLIPDVGNGTALSSTDVRYTQATWAHPATNVPLTALGFPGFFDRKFLPTPAEVRTGKSPDTAPCESASPASVELPASAARIGDLFAVSAAPGEIFANVSNTIKEKSGAVVTMPIGQANDALGYMPQSFELNPAGQQGLGFFFGGVLVVNYEDAYSIDRCVGDKVLETTIGLFSTI